MIEELGENYEYLRVIVNNSLELKKIDWIEKSSKLIGLSIYYLVIGIFLTIGLAFTFVGLFILISQLLGSYLWSSAIMVFLMMLLILLFLKFKKNTYH